MSAKKEEFAGTKRFEKLYSILAAVDQVEQRLVALGEIGRFRGPVVHLRVDVDRPVATPRCTHVLIPDPL